MKNEGKNKKVCVYNFAQCIYKFCYFQEFQISAIERKIIQEIEIRILKITYRELVIEDGEEMVMNVAEHEAVRSSFSTPVKSYRILEGMGVTFHSIANPLPDIVWLKNSDIISPHKYPHIKIEGTKGQAHFQIPQTTGSDSAWYTATAINKAGRDTTRCRVNAKDVAPPEIEPLHLRYGQEQWEEGDLDDKEKQQKPHFKKKITSVRMKRFGPVHFECRLTPIGDPTMVVEWLHDGKPLEAANRLRMINEFGFCSLDYEVAYSRDSGAITCRATNNFGADQTSATLIVKDEKSLVEDKQVFEGETAKYRCRVTGYPTPKVNWYLNGQLIRKSKRFRQHYDGIHYLEITDCKYWLKTQRVQLSMLSSLKSNRRKTSGQSCTVLLRRLRRHLALNLAEYLLML
uniref:Ig-like domain-containing protein n=1 Tax=Sinocyclocheilus rhinocerous TaxID=307959 RepID=A0A673GNA3_9TELE